jgi:hypothetical protein
MDTIVEATSQPFDLDAILKEFNVDTSNDSSTSKQEDSAITRVRESLGLGRTLLKRKQSPIANDDDTTEEHGTVPTHQDDETSTIEKPAKPRKRILDSDDEDDVPISKPINRSSSTIFSPPDESDNTSINGDNDTPISPMSDDDLPSNEAIIADFRKARLEALAAKVAAKESKESKVSEEEEPAISEGPRSPSASPKAEQKQKIRKASNKAVEEMHRETQRMARNMTLRPEIKPAKKIDMTSVFAKFGFNSQANQSETSESDEKTTPETTEEGLQTNSTKVVPRVVAPQIQGGSFRIRERTPVLLAESDSDDSLPSPSKLLLKSKSSPKPKVPTPRKVQFTIPLSHSSDSDSDVEIIHPPRKQPSKTPDRTRKRTAFLRNLANVKSPLKSPGRITQRELDAALSKEAALQATRKREERRAELKSLGIDVDRVIEKRDLLEDAREEARRVRLEEGGEESDEEYVDEDEGVEGDDDNSNADDESGDASGSEGDEEEGSGEEEGMEGEEIEEEAEDIIEDEPKKRKGPRKQITSDNEDEGESEANIPESIVGSVPQTHQTLPDLHCKDNVSLTQFFVETQLSCISQKTTQKDTASQSKETGTGLTQFFTSTALDEDTAATGDDAAHNRMNQLRCTSLTEAPIRATSPTLYEMDEPTELFAQDADLSVVGNSPVGRRILKRRKILPKKSKPQSDLKSEEFIKSRGDFIEEQAEESEDEYAAWRSGDESENENMDGVVDGLIDDDTKINEKKAEKEIAKLYMSYSFRN